MDDNKKLCNEETKVLTVCVCHNT